MSDFLVIGECVADIVRTPGQPDVPHPGGSPANVAYGLARLGHATALLTQLGDDPSGKLITDHLRSAGVHLLADGRPDVRTPTAVVTLDEQGAARYDFDIAWTLGPVEPPAALRHVHIGSIAAVAEPGAATTVDLAARLRADATVSYDPNIRPELMGTHERGVAGVERCVALSDLVKASDEDLEWLYPGEPVAAVAARWLAAGPAVVFVTMGGEGAAAFTRDIEVTGAAVRTEVADTVGAGDSFMSATLDALTGLGLTDAAARPALGALDKAALAHVLRHAGTAAALTVSRPGANPPTTGELRAALA
ncbi:carbohydrate kinase family protein [Streptomyces sp. CBMA29]|uniref:carbohydrate kinase family protein n=1 Tax=Streptomyces sp. CBMA29 TaxID=1896314 RepID=UPI00397F575F